MHQTGKHTGKRIHNQSVSAAANIVFVCLILIPISAPATGGGGAKQQQRGMYKKNKTKPTNGQNKSHQETTKKESQLTSDTLACWTISKQISQEDEVQQSVASLLPPPTLWDVSPFGNTGKLHVLTV